MAATSEPFSGDIMGIYADGTLVAHATDSSLSVTMDVIDTTEKDSNKWVEHIRGNRGWEISGNSLEVFASSMSVEQLIDFLINASSVSVQFKTTNVDDTVYSGFVSVTTTSFAAPQNSPSSFDFTFTGNGFLSKFSVEAAAAFAIYDSLGDGLTLSEKIIMNTYINAEVASGNHTLKDMEAIFSLSGNNALVDYIGGTLLVNTNAPTQSLNGFAYNGVTQYTNTGFNPLTDGVNLSQNDLYVVAFIKVANGGASANARYFGCFDSAPTATQIDVREENATNYRYSSSDNTNTSEVTSPSNNKLVGTLRTASGTKQMIIDGVQVDSSAVTSVVLPGQDIFIGANNVDGSDSQRIPATISSIMAGGGVGFDTSGNNTNLRTLLTDLGLTL